MHSTTTNNFIVVLYAYHAKGFARSLKPDRIRVTLTFKRSSFLAFRIYSALRILYIYCFVLLHYADSHLSNRVTS